MTEKRFIMDNDSDITEFDYKQNEYIQDFMFANGKSWDKICNRLNELYEENEQLKNSDTITDLETQIMKLKDENERLQYYESRYRERNLKLEKENKELKTILNKTLKQIYSAQLRLIWEYGTNLAEEEKQLKEHFKETYGKYGWKE